MKSGKQTIIVKGFNLLRLPLKQVSIEINVISGFIDVG